MKLTVIITYSPLNRDMGLLLSDCIKSFTTFNDVEILVEQAFTDSHSQTINNGLRHSKGDFILISNEDIRVPEGYELLLENFDNPDVYAVTPKETAKEPYLDFNASRFTDIEFPFGSCFIISRKCYEEIGGYDERFKPFFFDDTDYWKRIRDAGKLIISDDRVNVWHKQATASKQIAGEKYKQIYDRNQQLYREKWA